MAKKVKFLHNMTTFTVKPNGTIIVKPLKLKKENLIDKNFKKNTSEQITINLRVKKNKIFVLDDDSNNNAYNQLEKHLAPKSSLHTTHLVFEYNENFY